MIRQQQRQWAVRGDNNSRPLSSSEPKTIAWIENLLQTPISDYRKHSRGLIIIPYLVVCRGMTDIDQIQSIIMQWADTCAELRRLDSSRREFGSRVRSRTYEVMQTRIPPMRLETLKEKNRRLFNK